MTGTFARSLIWKATGWTRSSTSSLPTTRCAAASSTPSPAGAPKRRQRLWSDPRSGRNGTMASVEDRCKTALDETRTLMLGAQVLLGFQFNAFFQERFSQLPELHQLLWLVTLVA